MNIIEQFRADEERVLDRLVDGELSHGDRRELLAALDDEPGAWRRCALAFLESQAWHSQLTRLAAEPVVVGAPPDTAGKPWLAVAAIAASLLLAFGLGTRFPRVTTTDPAAGPAIVRSNPAEPQLREPRAEGADETAATDGSDVPAQLLDSLEKSGLKVTRQQWLWPVELADGRRFLVPVDEVEVTDPQVMQY